MNWWGKSTKRLVQLESYIEDFLILASTITSLIGIPIGITSSAIGLEIFCNNWRN